jgi:hypothetical protein
MCPTCRLVAADLQITNLVILVQKNHKIRMCWPDHTQHYSENAALVDDIMDFVRDLLKKKCVPGHSIDYTHDDCEYRLKKVSSNIWKLSFQTRKEDQESSEIPAVEMVPSMPEPPFPITEGYEERAFLPQSQLNYVEVYVE